MKQKMKLIAAFKVWLVIYPSITLFLILFGESLANLPVYLRTLVLTITLVPWMVYIGLPVLEKIQHRVFKPQPKNLTMEYETRLKRDANEA